MISVTYGSAPTVVSDNTDLKIKNKLFDSQEIHMSHTNRPPLAVKEKVEQCEVQRDSFFLLLQCRFNFI